LILNLKYQSPFPDSSPMPVITFNLSNALGNNPIEVTAGIDTGFDGFLLIPKKLYDDLLLEVAKIPKTLLSHGVTISGERIEFNSSYGLITLPDMVKDFEIEVDSNPNCIFPLVGRQLLSIFLVVMKGPENQCEIEYRIN